jgi:SAM-dependent methyltransferase
LDFISFHSYGIGKVRPILSDHILSQIQELPKSQMWIGEAKFGLEQIRQYIEKLPEKSRILEVGSGSSILLSHLHTSYPHIHIDGIEPIGDGFDQFIPYHSALKGYNKNLTLSGYENFTVEKKYDLIFLINVFEHFENWPHFLVFLRKALTDTGVCVIMCPNYSFPYEPHFGIPIVCNKFITYILFRSYIDQFERNHRVENLWESLNFVTLSKVSRACKKNQLSIFLDLSIIDNYFKRTLEDDFFKERHPIIAKIIKLLPLQTIFKLFEIYPFKRFFPYLKMEIRKEENKDVP